MQIFLLLVPTLVSLTYPVPVDVPFGNMVRHILFRPQHTNDIHDEKIAFDIHHGDIEIQTDPSFFIVVQLQISDQTEKVGREYGKIGVTVAA